MNRRGFLAALAGAFVADPERALWVPGQKVISIPKPAIERPRLVYFFTANGDTWVRAKVLLHRTPYGDFAFTPEWPMPLPITP